MWTFAARPNLGKPGAMPGLPPSPESHLLWEGPALPPCCLGSRPAEIPIVLFRVHSVQTLSHRRSMLILLALLSLNTLPLLLLLRILLASSKSPGCSPLALAKRFNISVRLTTPLNLPDIAAPGSAEAETLGVVLRGRKGGWVCGVGDTDDGT